MSLQDKLQTPAVELREVAFRYDNTPLFQGTNLRIREGEFIGVIGPNGGGKTTLLKLLMGFLTPSSGTIAVCGQTPKEARRKIGYVPQAHRMDRDFPITLFELVLLGSLAKTDRFGRYPAEEKAKALAWTQRLGLEDHKHKAFGSLSGGLAQRALLARALLSDPKLLILDEPTANVDAASSHLIFEILEEVRGKKTILLVTHDLRAIVEKADLFLCVQGQIQLLAPHEICEHFALGLYHTPLLEHLKKRSDALAVY